MVACQAARSWRGAMERSSSWHWEQSFSVSALPGPGGSWAKAAAAKRSRIAATGECRQECRHGKLKACSTERLVLDREAEGIEHPIMSTKIQLRAASGEAAAVGD